MGLLNIPEPAFTVVDQALAGFIPSAGRLAFWAVVAGVGTMLLYRLLSPQKRIGAAKREARKARRRLNQFDGELTDAGPLIRGQFVSAFRHFGLVVPPTLLSILPLLCLLVWLDTHYSRGFPTAGSDPELSVEPDTFSAQWQQGDMPRVKVYDDETELIEVEMAAPVPVIERRQWWNYLIDNPLGYLPENSPIERVHIDLPEQQHVSFGPSWMRSWLAIFFPVMFVTSLMIYRLARIE